jgi:hypothetical protein
MTQRPRLRQLRFLTSKYFEIFCADTIPLLLLESGCSEEIYGPAGRELILDTDIEAKLMDVFERPGRYIEAVTEVRCHLTRYHSYTQRVKELVAALSHDSVPEWKD